MVAGVVVLFGCFPSLEDLEAIDYAPLPGDDWPVSTPEAQGLDPMLVAEPYYPVAGMGWAAFRKRR